MAQYIEKFEGGGSPKIKPLVLERYDEQVPVINVLKLLDNNEDLRKEYYAEQIQLKSGRKPKKEELEYLDKNFRERREALESGRLVLKTGDQSDDSKALLSNKEFKTGIDLDSINQSWMNKAFQKAPSTKKEQESKSKYDPNKGISVLINRELFNGRDTFDPEFINIDNDYNEETGKRGISKRLTELVRVTPIAASKARDTYNMTDDQYSALQQAVQKFSNAISDGQFTDNERIALSNLGLSPDMYLYTGLKYGDDDSESEPEKSELDQLKEEYLKQQQQVALNKLRHYNELQSVEADPNNVLDLSKYSLPYTEPSLSDRGKIVHDKYWTNAVKAMEGYFPNNNIYAKGNDWWELKNDNFGIPTYLSFTDKDGNTWDLIGKDMTNGQKLLRLLNMMYKSPGANIIQNDGRMVLQVNNGVVTLFDYNKQQLQDVPVRQIPSLFNQLYPDEVSAASIAFQKEGGILKAQQGMFLAPMDNYDQALKEYDQAQKKKKEDEIKKKAEKQGRTVEQYEKAQRQVGEGLTAVDKARMAAIAVDLGSVVASLTGVGSIAGGAAGAVGSLIDFGADLADDSVTASDMWKNLGVGLGLSAIGLIPTVGAVGKFGKTISKVVKYAPKLLTLATAGTIALDTDVQKSLKKFSDISLDNISNPTEWFKKNKVTNDDLRNLAIAFGAVTGITRAGINSGKKAIVKAGTKKTPIGESYSIDTKNGKININKETYNQFQKTESLEEANKILKGLQDQSENSIIGSRKYKVVGPREKFDKNVLKTTKQGTKYEIDSNQTTLGKWILGDINNRWHDSGMILHNLNNPIILGTPSGIFFKKEVTSPEAASTTVARTVSKSMSRVKPGHGPTARSILPYGTTNQTRNMGMPRSYAIGNYKSLEQINKIKPDPNRTISVPYLDPVSGAGEIKILPNGNKIFVAFKEGGKLDFFKNGGILKGADGLVVPDILKDKGVTDIYSVVVWDPTRKQYVKQGDNYILQNRTTNATDSKYNSSLYVPENEQGTIEGYIPGKHQSAADLENTVGYQTFNNILRTNRDVLKMWLDGYAKYRGKGADRRIMRHHREDGTWDLDNGVIDDVMALRTDTKFGGAHDVNQGITYYLEGDPNTYYNLSDEELKNFDIVDNNEWDEGGLVHKYMLKLKNSNPQENSQKNSQNPQEIPQDSKTPIEGYSKTYGNGEIPNDKDNERTYPYDLTELKLRLLSDGKLWNVLKHNKDIWNTKRDSLLFTTKQPFELQSPVYENYYATIQGLNKQGQTRFLGNEAITSDIDKVLAFKGDLNRQANNIAIQTAIANNEKREQTSEIARKYQDQNKQLRTEVANYNREAGAKHIAMLGQLRSDYLLKRANAISGRITEEQQRDYAKLQEIRGFKSGIIKDRADLIYNNKVREALLAYQEARKNLKPGQSPYDLQEYKDLLAIQSSAGIDRDNYINSELGNLYGITGYNPFKVSVLSKYKS